MIINNKFIEWYDKQDSETQGSVINFVIITCASMNLWSRIKIAFEILMGKKYSLWVSRNQHKS